MRTYIVKVYESPSHREIVAAARQGKESPRPTPQPDIRVQGRNVDVARKEVKKRLGKLRSLSVGLQNVLHAVLQHPDDV